MSSRVFSSNVDEITSVLFVPAISATVNLKAVFFLISLPPQCLLLFPLERLAGLGEGLARGERLLEGLPRPALPAHLPGRLAQPRVAHRATLALEALTVKWGSCWVTPSALSWGWKGLWLP